MPPKVPGDNIPSLPLDIYAEIFSYPTQRTLKSCRLLSKAISPVATSQAFRHIYLSAASVESPAAFTKIAQSPHLRSQVNEITIDTWVGPDFEYHVNGRYPFPITFFRALPYLRAFPSVRTLNVRFSKWCGNDEGEEGAEVSYEETYDFRAHVLNAVFKCAAGMWNTHEQTEWDEEAVNGVIDAEIYPVINTYLAEDLEARRIVGYAFEGMPALKRLTISHLADYDDECIVDTEAFRKVMYSPSLTELKLLIATETDEEEPERDTGFPEPWAFFRSIHKTWLSPPIAKKLEVLSLFYKGYWGWAPRADFRSVNPGSGTNDSSAGFPKLRVLALGNYIFSHDWQIDWIASLGKQNGHGGLQELYLDECPILWHGETGGPMAEGTMEYRHKASDLEQEIKLKLSNKGYPRETVMTDDYFRGGAQDEVPHTWEIRWADIIDRWHDSMSGLKTFKMGHGSWDNDYVILVKVANDLAEDRVVARDEGYYSARRDSEVEEDDDLESLDTPDSDFPSPGPAGRARRTEMHRYEHRVHLDYDCPTVYEGHQNSYTYPGAAHKTVKGLTQHEIDTQVIAPLKYGTGLRQRRADVMPYIKFDWRVGPSQWLRDTYFGPRDPQMEDEEEDTEEDEEDPAMRKMPDYKEVMKRDDEALERFHKMIAERGKSR